MELIYTDKNMVEKGDIQDFEFDLAYGKDENDFEIKTSENEMQQGYYWFVKGTQYGGVVDEIEATTNNYEVTYRGRSFQGILGSFYGWQLISDDGITVRHNTIDLYSTPTELAKTIINQLDIPIIVDDAIIDEPILNETVDRGLDIYQLLRYAFEKNNFKIKLYFDGGIHLGVESAIDYTSGLYFDISRFTVKVNKKNVPNHLIGVFKQDRGTVIKHMYANRNGIILPYYILDSNHEQPFHDYEYERVEGEPVITGLEERVAVIEGGSVIENYDVVTELTTNDGNTEFENGVPKDWNDRCYTDFYYKEIDEETGEVKFKNYEVELEDVPFVVAPYTHPIAEQKTADWWNQNWMTCFKLSDGSLQQLSISDCEILTTYKPIYWNDDDREFFRYNYKNYYYFVSDPDNYAQIEGKTVYDKSWQYTRGSEWDTNRGDFWFSWTRKKWRVDLYINGKYKNKRWVFETGVDGTPTINTFEVTKSHPLSSYSQFNGGNISKDTKIYLTASGKKGSANDYFLIHPPVNTVTVDVSLSTYCAMTGKKLENIPWESNKYYLRVAREVEPDTLPYPIYDRVVTVSSTPPIDDGQGNPKIYYVQEDRDKPAFEQGQTYCKVNDHYTNLCQKMIDKYNELIAQASVIEPTVNTDIGEFDVGDIIGSVHPFTDEPLTSKLTKKIVKGNSFKTEVSYEIR